MYGLLILYTGRQFSLNHARTRQMRIYRSKSRIPMRKKGRATSVKKTLVHTLLMYRLPSIKIIQDVSSNLAPAKFFIYVTISLVLNSGVLINLDTPVSGVIRLESPIATSSATLSLTWAPVCDANLYGTPPLAGCREAFAKLRNYGEGTIVPYRQRGSPLFPGVISLPARYSSCKYDFGLIRYDWLFIRLMAC